MNISTFLSVALAVVAVAISTAIVLSPRDPPTYNDHVHEACQNSGGVAVDVKNITGDVIAIRCDRPRLGGVRL